VIHLDYYLPNRAMEIRRSILTSTMLANGEIDGGYLPDSGFFNPRNLESKESTDVFSLRSIYYTIMTGHCPYRSSGPFKSAEEM
jgi:hypothetical protein